MSKAKTQTGPPNSTDKEDKEPKKRGRSPISQLTHSDAHKITGIDATPIEHDAKGNMTLDEDGNTYAWDFDNRLKEVRNSNGDLLGAYTYDALGRRTSKTVPDNFPGAPNVTTAFVCLTDNSDMGQIIAEY